MKYTLLALAFFLPLSASAAALSISSPKSQVEVGERVVVSIVVSSPEQSVNAVSGVLAVPESFSIESVSRASSILNFWVTEPTFSNTTRSVSFEGVALTGFQGSRGIVLSVTLRAAKEGSASLAFPSAQILANDGAGTDVTQGRTGTTITIVPATAVPKEDVFPAVDERPVEYEAVRPPTLTLQDRAGVRMLVVESAYPAAPVVISFTGEGSTLYVSGVTNDNGVYATPLPASLRGGTYSVEASLMKDNAPSGPSSTLEVVITEGLVPTGLAFIIFVAISALVLCAIVVALMLRRVGVHSGFNRLMLGEVEEADTVVRKSFKLLRSDARAIARGGGKAARRAEALEENLAEAEEIIRKEIDDIRDSADRS